jgi:regulator of ribonuclease activity B
MRQPATGWVMLRKTQAPARQAPARRLANGGSDLSKPMYINFQVVVPDEPAARGLAQVASKLGYHADYYASPECSLPWTCECSTRMIASYDGVIATQNELAKLAAPFGGHPDGWGSFENDSDDA